MRKLNIITTTLAAFIFVLVLSLPLHARADSAFKEGAVGQSKVEAADLLRSGDSAGAYELYSRLYRDNPDDDEVVLGLARSAAAAGKHNQAVMAYERLIALYPNDPGLYAEIAASYMALNDRATAERYMAKVRALDSKTTEEQTTLALDTMERSNDRFQYHGRVRVGVLYDSNANQGPSTSTMDIGNFRDVVVPGVQSKETFGGYLGADVDFGWRTTPDGSWWMVSDFGAFVRGNTNSDLARTDSRESQWGRAALGARRLTSTTLFDLRFKAEIFDYELTQNISAVGPEAVFLWAVTPSVQLISRGSLDKRTYSQDGGRDGAYYWLGQYLRLFMGERNHEVLFGARYLGGVADNGNYSYSGWEGSLGFTFKLPYQFELSPFVSFTQEFYHGPATVLEGKDRQDDRWRTGANLVYHINEDWDAELLYQYTNNDSNSPLYDYDQHLVTAGVAWKF